MFCSSSTTQLNAIQKYIPFYKHIYIEFAANLDVHLYGYHMVMTKMEYGQCSHIDIAKMEINNAIRCTLSL